MNKKNWKWLIPKFHRNIGFYSSPKLETEFMTQIDLVKLKEQNYLISSATVVIIKYES